MVEFYNEPYIINHYNTKIYYNKKNKTPISSFNVHKKTIINNELIGTGVYCDNIKEKIVNIHIIWKIHF